MTVKGGMEEEFDGIVYPLVVGIKAGPRSLHMFGARSTYKFIYPVGAVGAFLEVSEPTGEEGEPNIVLIPQENVAFIAKPMFLIKDPPKA